MLTIKKIDKSYKTNYKYCYKEVKINGTLASA